MGGGCAEAVAVDEGGGTDGLDVRAGVTGGGTLAGVDARTEDGAGVGVDLAGGACWEPCST